MGQPFVPMEGAPQVTDEAREIFNLEGPPLPEIAVEEGEGKAEAASSEQGVSSLLPPAPPILKVDEAGNPLVPVNQMEGEHPVEAMPAPSVGISPGIEKQITEQERPNLVVPDHPAPPLPGSPVFKVPDHPAPPLPDTIEVAPDGLPEEASAITATQSPENAPLKIPVLQGADGGRLEQIQIAKSAGEERLPEDKAISDKPLNAAPLQGTETKPPQEAVGPLPPADGDLPSGPALVQQLVEYIRLAVARKQSEWRLKLNPPSLGQLEVHLNVKGDALTVRMSAETEAVRGLIEAHLRNNLSERGLRLEALNINVADEQGFGFAFGGQPRSWQDSLNLFTDSYLPSVAARGEPVARAIPQPRIRQGLVDVLA